jgi:hypothetical protein
MVGIALFSGAALGAQGAAAAPGERVIAAARLMCGENPEHVNGVCWDFVNAVFFRAGFPPAARQTVFSGKKAGPYADTSLIRPGDWLYLTASGSDWEHSVIFIRWVPPMENGLAVVAEYSGSFRLESGFIDERPIGDVWGIYRAKEEGSWGALPE